MNNQANLLQQAPESRSRELVKHRLNGPAETPATPEIDHWVLQLWGVEPAQLNDPETLNVLLKGVTEELRLTRVSDHTHFFGPGVSTVIILSESHLSAHTWPELGYMHVDIVTCVKKLTHTRLETVFRRTFTPDKLQLDQLEY